MIQCRWIGIIDDYFRAQAPRAQVHLRLTCCETQLSAPPSASRYNYAYAVRRRWRDEWRAVADVRAWARGHTWITCTFDSKVLGSKPLHPNAMELLQTLRHPWIFRANSSPEPLPNAGSRVTHMHASSCFDLLTSIFSLSPQALVEPSMDPCTHSLSNRIPIC